MTYIVVSCILIAIAIAMIFAMARAADKIAPPVPPAPEIDYELENLPLLEAAAWRDAHPEAYAQLVRLALRDVRRTRYFGGNG